MRGLVSLPAHERVAPVVMPWDTWPALQVLLQIATGLTNISCHICKLHTDISDAAEHFKGLSAPIWEQLKKVLPSTVWGEQFGWETIAGLGARSLQFPVTVKQETLACLQSSGALCVCRHLKRLRILSQILPRHKKSKALVVKRLCAGLSVAAEFVSCRDANTCWNWINTLQPGSW